MAPPQVIQHTHKAGMDENDYEEEFNYRDIGTMRDVKKEMVLIYKLQRRGSLDSQEYGRLVVGLNSISNVIRDTEIENRMKVIEEFMAKKGG